MKTYTKYCKIVSSVLLVSTVLMAVGCGKSASSDSVVNNNGNPVVPPIHVQPPIGGGGTPTFSSGSTSDFTPVSLQAMNDYVGTRPLNNPSNIKINVNLAQVEAGRYGGTISISYIDNGIQYNGQLKSGLGRNQSAPGMYDNDRLESDYNYWFRLNNQTIFSGFFEDNIGAITLTLVPINNNQPGGNDGEPIGTAQYKGYVYFKNFTVAMVPHSPYRSCWFKYIGPYDCRSNIIQTKHDLFPGAGAGYKLLGTFENISINSAFNLTQ